MNRRKPEPIQWFLLCISLFAINVWADDDEILINNLPSLIPFTLSSDDINAGTLESGDINFCVIASDDDDERENFKFKLTQDTGSNNEFRLYNSSSTLPLTVKTGSYYSRNNTVLGLDNLQEIKPGQATQKKYKGGLSCSDGNYGQSRLRFSFNPNLQNLVAGDYEANLTLKAITGDERATFAFTIRVTVPSMVKISRLDDITLVNSGSLGYTGFDNFCVYSSTEDFWIKAEGSPAHGNAFLLHKGTHSLAHSVILGRNDHTLSAITVTPGEKVDINATPVNCETSDNSHISIIVDETVANMAQAGTYTGTVYLTVEPK